MELSITVGSECDPRLDPIVQKSIMTKDSHHHWKSLFLDGYSMDPHNEIVLRFTADSSQGSFQLLRILVPLGELVHYPEPYNKFTRKSDRTKRTVFDSLERIASTNNNLRIRQKETDATVYLSYMAFMYRDLTDNQTSVGQIRIHSLTLEYDVSRIERYKGHQITCMINDNYLGRAQECVTCETARYMCWKPTHEWSCMSPRREGEFDHVKQEAWELSCIRKADPAGLGLKQPNFSILMDNDAYSNAVRRLPRFLSEKDLPVRISLYNFKYHPPRMVETVLKYKDFENSTCLVYHTPRLKDVKSPRKGLFVRRKKSADAVKTRVPSGTLERTLVRGMTLRVAFHMRDKIEIEYVKLHIANYETTLDMDEMQEPNTV